MTGSGPPTPQAAAAVQYAAEPMNWKIFPVWGVDDDNHCRCGALHDDRDAPRDNIGKHPIGKLVERGVLDATNDVLQIARWWAAEPSSSIGLNCKESGLLVVDVDPRNGGESTWLDIESQLEVPATLRARTGSGGFHLFFEAEDLSRVPKTLGPGVDLKFQGGYVILAPSRHGSGQSYHWETQGVRPAKLGPLKQYLVERGARTRATDRQASGNQPGLAAGGGGGELHETLRDVEAMMASAKDIQAGGQRDYLLRLIGKMWALGYAPSIIEREATRIATQELVQFDTTRPWTQRDVVQICADTQRRFDPAEPMELTPEEIRWANDANAMTQQADQATRPSTINDRILQVAEPLRDGVIQRIRQHEVDRLARQLIRAEEFTPPSGERLDVLLDSGVPDPIWTIEGLHETGTNMSLTAQFKTGKTTLQLNMMKALADYEPFLDHFETERIEGNIAFFNYELTARQFLRWASRLNIVHPEKIFVLNMRGLRLDISDDFVRDWTVEWLRKRDIQFWFIDPLARAYYGDENDNTLLKLWTDNVDEIKERALVSDVQVSLHTGRMEMEEGEERARGATRIDDWVDGRLVLVRRGQERFLRATGREVDFPETRLLFDEDTWRLRIGGEDEVGLSRRTFASVQAQSAIESACQSLGATTSDEAVPKRQLLEALGGNRNEWGVRIAEAVRSGILATRAGPRNSTLHWLVGSAVVESMQAWAAGLSDVENVPAHESPSESSGE